MMADPDGVKAGRLAFLSPPLSRDLHLSGTPEVDLHASLDKPQSNLGALLVDYGGPTTHVSRSGDGVHHVPADGSSDWGLSSLYDSARYLELSRILTDTSTWRITKGILDSSNRDSLPRQRRLARAALDAGASAIIGAHTHVLQPIVRPRRHRVVAYGLGNFVFTPRNAWATRTGILELRLSARGVERAHLRGARLVGTRPELTGPSS